MKRWFYVDLPYACFGFSSLNGVVIDTPPIFSWAQGKTLQEIKPFLLRKKAKVTEITKGLNTEHNR